MKKVISILFILFTINTFAININIPDVDFKNYLLSRTDSINTNKDSEISDIEASSFVGKIDISQKKISSIEGIEAFINLTVLNCSENALVTIDLTKNIKLKELIADFNQFTEIDLTKNVELKKFRNTWGKFVTLDLSKNLKLESLYISKTGLVELNVSNNTALTYLSCTNHKFTNIDLSKNVNLTSLSCSNLSLTSLDISTLTNLEKLYCDNNKLQNLDLSNNTKIAYIYAYNNLLENLDLSKNTNLVGLFIYNNLIKKLDLTKTPKIGMIYVNNTPTLDSICVLPNEDVSTWVKDETATYYFNCTATTGIEDALFLQNKSIAYIYNLQGQQVSEFYKGFVVIKYTDGSIEKKIQE